MGSYNGYYSAIMAIGYIHLNAIGEHKKYATGVIFNVNSPPL